MRVLNVFVFDESAEVRKVLIAYFVKNWQKQGKIYGYEIKIHSVVGFNDLERRLQRCEPNLFFISKNLAEEKRNRIRCIIGSTRQESSVVFVEVETLQLALV
jgi:hypothetical protein